jgi:tyrosine decarboxylase/aspartate 1-decarboxylase
MFNEEGMNAEDVLERLDELLRNDATYRTGHPIASMSTIPHSLGVDVFSRTLEKNAGRLHTFKGSAEVERQVMGMLGNLLQLETPFGTTTSGGTESNILAMLAYRERAKRRTKNPEVIVPRNAHMSLEKAAWMLGVNVVKANVDREFKARAKDIEKKITNDTVGIFATAGTTYLGQIDPVEEIGEIASSNRIPLHVDAAFGGFVIPFLADLGRGDYAFDFSVKGVTSISTDPHKMGLAPIPSGALLFNKASFMKNITRKVPYLRGASANQSSVLGTRPGASILATWAIMNHLGREGYRQVVAGCMQVTDMLAERVMKNPMLDLAIKPVMNILGIKSREVPLETIVEKMEARGWRMATSPLPPTLRLVVMPHVTEGTANAFFNVLDEVSTTIPPD